MADTDHKVPWRWRLGFGAFGGLAIGGLTGAASGEAAAYALGWSTAGPHDPRTALAAAILGAIGGALSGVVAADS
jgi:hypothetical protein